MLQYQRQISAKYVTINAMTEPCTHNSFATYDALSASASGFPMAPPFPCLLTVL